MEIFTVQARWRDFQLEDRNARALKSDIYSISNHVDTGMSKLNVFNFTEGDGEGMGKKTKLKCS